MTDEEMLEKAYKLEELSKELNDVRGVISKIDDVAMRALKELKQLRRPKGDEFEDEYNDPRDEYGAEIVMLIDELDDWAELLKTSAGK